MRVDHRAVCLCGGRGRCDKGCAQPCPGGGQSCTADRINQIAKDNGLVVIEDGAQSFGAAYKGRRAGGLGDIGCTSFFPAKPLGCYGDGGAVFTNSDEMAETLVSIRVHGKGSHKYDNVRLGINGRLDTLQAAVLLAKMTIFPGEIQKRRQAAKQYTEVIGSLQKMEGPFVEAPRVPNGYESAWAQYALLAEDEHLRVAVREQLYAFGIPTMVYYPTPLHLQTAYQDLGYKKGDFPVSEDVSSRIFSLPMHPYLGAAVYDGVRHAFLTLLKNYGLL